MPTTDSERDMNSAEECGSSVEGGLACSLGVREVSLEEGMLELGLKRQSRDQACGEKVFWEGAAGTKAGLENQSGKSFNWLGREQGAISPCAPVGSEASILVPLKVWPEKHWIPLPVHDKNKYIN